eukprot:TRINITY_DN130_c0_g1_i1.p1 TRINITY_DN130_c0_g1~~TRINITY_DN130_c0_g1_i1.p1  ORF type:complete len:131 (-),score=24.39 TRINITY_DN130_c0_g1_i1:1265-1657(-)
MHPFQPPEGPKPAKKEWVISNKLAKSIVASNAFWNELNALLPSLTVPVAEPWKLYLLLLRQLCIQVISWEPQNVDLRTRWAFDLHQIFVQLGLPEQRFTVQVHYFMDHYTERLIHHGNLLCISTEGGEHL